MLQTQKRFFRWAILPTLPLVLSVLSPALAAPASASEHRSAMVVTVDSRIAPSDGGNLAQYGGSGYGGYGSVTPLGLGGFGYGGSYPYFYRGYPYYGGYGYGYPYYGGYGYGGFGGLGYGGYGGYGGFGGFGGFGGRFGGFGGRFGGFGGFR